MVWTWCKVGLHQRRKRGVPNGVVSLELDVEMTWTCVAPFVVGLFHMKQIPDDTSRYKPAPQWLASILGMVVMTWNRYVISFKDCWVCLWLCPWKRGHLTPPGPWGGNSHWRDYTLDGTIWSRIAASEPVGASRFVIIPCNVPGQIFSFQPQALVVDDISVVKYIHDC